MCLSPEVDFVAGTAIAGVGVATLMAVRRPRDLVIGALPLGFGLHQITEGFVWLGLRGQVSSGLGDAARDAYVIYAQAVLPMLVPVGFALLERDARRRRWLWPFVVLGVLTGLFLLWQVTHWPILAEERAHCVAYTTHTPYAIPSATAYVLAVCAPALLSSRRHLRTFGIVNVVGLAFAATMQEEEFTSVWCLYAAVMSVLILAHFRRERAGPDDGDPGGVDDQPGESAAQATHDVRPDAPARPRPAPGPTPSP